MINTIPGVKDVDETINSFYFYLPRLVFYPEQQKNSESFTSCFTLSFDSWVTDRKPIINRNKYQLDIGSASYIDVALYPISAHQKTQRDKPAGPPIQFDNAIFDKVDVRRYVLEIDGVSYQKDPIELSYSENNYSNHNSCFDLLYQESKVESF